MLGFRFWHPFFVGVLSVALPLAPSMAAPPVVAGSASETPTAPAPLVLDVSLGEGGMLAGSFQGVAQSPLASAVVELRQNGQVIAQARTNAQGKFAFAGVAGGIYQLTAKQAQSANVANQAAGGKAQVAPETLYAQQVVRAWAKGTAPPQAASDVSLAAVVVRGQHSAGRFGKLVEDAKYTFAHPLVIGGVVAAAVAIPVALHNSDDDDDSGS